MRASLDLTVRVGVRVYVGAGFSAARICRMSAVAGAVLVSD